MPSREAVVVFLSVDDDIADPRNVAAAAVSRALAQAERLDAHGQLCVTAYDGQPLRARVHAVYDLKTAMQNGRLRLEPANAAYPHDTEPQKDRDERREQAREPSTVEQWQRVLDDMKENDLD
jgi:hypothetical protein